MNPAFSLQDPDLLRQQAYLWVAAGAMRTAA